MCQVGSIIEINKGIMVASPPNLVGKRGSRGMRQCACVEENEDTTQGRTPRRERTATRRGATAPRRTNTTAQSNSNQARSLASLTHSHRGGAAWSVTRGTRHSGWHAPTRHGRSPHDTHTAGYPPLTRARETVPAMHRESELERGEAMWRWVTRLSGVLFTPVASIQSKAY